MTGTTPFSAAAVRAALTLLVLVQLLGISPPASASVEVAPAHRIGRAYFGMHDGDPTTWPAADVGSIRLWDSGTSWRELEPRPGVFDFARLDAVVAEAGRHRTRVTLVLGQTPSFHASPTSRRPAGVEYYGPDATRMPDIAAWRSYVRHVARRYAGRIEAFQVWNEPNVAGFWSGSTRQLGQLTYWAWREVRRVERERHVRIRLVAPSFLCRSNTGVMDDYWAQRVRGHRMSDVVDVVALSLYPPRTLGPEASMRLLRQVRRGVLVPRKVDLPIWSSEVNYGIAPGGAFGSPVRLTPERQAAYVLRTYVLSAAENLRRVFWYSWDQEGVASVVMAHDNRPTLAGRALGRAQRWLRTGPLLGCAVRADRTRVCRLGGSRHARISWNPGATARVRVSRPSVVTDIHGEVRRTRAGRLLVDYRPVLVRDAT